MSSDRSKLLLPDVMLSDSFCFQCMATNDYGTLVGDGCLTVIDKIDIILPPDDVYTITPDMTLTIIVDAVTDAQWQKQMKFEWFWYDMVIDPDTNQKKTGKTCFKRFLSTFFRLEGDSVGLTSACSYCVFYSVLVDGYTVHWSENINDGHG